MARRKGWENLSPSYRQRLERAGVDRVHYEIRSNLKAARGHSVTPERPSVAIKNPGRYRDYIARRGDPIVREAEQWQSYRRSMPAPYRNANNAADFLAGFGQHGTAGFGERQARQDYLEESQIAINEWEQLTPSEIAAMADDYPFEDFDDYGDFDWDLWDEEYQAD